MNKVYAIDFDGTLCENKYPDIGEPIQEVIDFVKEAKDNGDKIILWTCRTDDELDQAIEWCENQGLIFDAINENLPEHIELYGGDTRKIFADCYIDDKNITLDDIKNGIVEVRTKMDKNIPQTRSISPGMCELKTRADGETDMYIEGYFVVYNRETELWPGYFEQVAPEAMSNTLGNDIKALINHDTTLVLGRNKANTLELKSDGHGLWGSIKINPNDTDAMNLYERVKRGDVDQCSFGFNIGNEGDDYRDDGTIHTTLKEIDLWEVSVVTFPAYEETGVQARKKDIEQQKQRQLDVRKKKLKERLKDYGNKTVDAE